MPDYSKEFTCTDQGACVACTSGEWELEYCKLNKYKQEVACEWNGGVPKDYQDTHSLPDYIACQNPAELNRKLFFRNQLVFIILGIAAFAVYTWRIRKLRSTSYSSV
ncbi:hypothetical protein GGI04_001075 [Coemansia thaxteri]|uniref:Uncharacterized protein n=1 Tax=Coemansia thaxteri TaxID=2663907 RepID=A0A9W8BM40_9FUNG|nr:hypothetical protein H4R26_001849 [Coemansia thaxteri]KAJ2008579.1 hypothetical protein GGI04_001075 [Coemansia thaxteri]KAJ2474432.1 hypothetical protein GGI02_000054 [Coemansia sp. RSA 2322]KAJ2488202.1 hypothetical protein EV174_000008 [Coemansia sp. RSA 2320]